jgi:hypothetical protein
VPDTTAVSDPSPDSDARWAAWQAKGAAHDRAVRRKLTVFMPIVIIVAAALVYALLAR